MGNQHNYGLLRLNLEKRGGNALVATTLHDRPPKNASGPFFNKKSTHFPVFVFLLPVFSLAHHGKLQQIMYGTGPAFNPANLES